MRPMQDYRLNMEEGEDVDLRSLGAFSPEALGRWRIGEWVKTNRRLLFLQRGTPKFSVICDSLVEISPCQREHSFKEKHCLKFFLNDGGDNKIFQLLIKSLQLIRLFLPDSTILSSWSIFTLYSPFLSWLIFERFLKRILAGIITTLSTEPQMNAIKGLSKLAISSTVI